MSAKPIRRLGARLVDDGPLTVLAVIAAAGSFTHIRDLAARAGQHGWMSWAIAVCIDLTCVMAARERHRDQHTGRHRRGWISWPALVLTGGVVLSLAANLAQAQPTVWGYIIAGVPAAAFLCAVSMLERRTTQPAATRPADDHQATAPVLNRAPEATAEVAPTGTDAPVADLPEVAPGLRALADRVAVEHCEQHGRPITADQLCARLRVPPELATRLHAELNTV